MPHLSSSSAQAGRLSLPACAEEVLHDARPSERRSLSASQAAEPQVIVDRTARNLDKPGACPGPRRPQGTALHYDSENSQLIVKGFNKRPEAKWRFCRMTKNPEPSRREFLSHGGKLVIGEALLSLTTNSGAATPPEPQSDALKRVTKSQLKSTEFLFGASVYPELQTKDEWNKMLDQFQRAHMNGVRVSESSWGNLETAAGKYNFAWLRSFLDDLQKRNMKAILGTGSYVSPAVACRRQPGDTGSTSPRREGASNGTACAMFESSVVPSGSARVHPGSGEGIQ